MKSALHVMDNGTGTGKFTEMQQLLSQELQQQQQQQQTYGSTVASTTGIAAKANRKRNSAMTMRKTEWKICSIRSSTVFGNRFTTQNLNGKQPKKR